MPKKPAEKKCPVCGAVKVAKDFYGVREAKRGSKFHGACRACVGRMIADVRDPVEMESACRDFNVPYCDKLWRMSYNKAVEKGDSLSGDALLGRYMRLINMRQYNRFGTYADQDGLRQYLDDRHPEPVEYVEAPDIHEAEAAALAAKEAETRAAQAAKKAEALEAEAQAKAREKEEKAKADAMELERMRQDTAGRHEQAIYDSLTPDDINMLVRKWGGDFLPSEWVKMEDLYNKYVNEYDMNIDREQALIAICKTTVKMDAALVQGNVADYQKLASVLKDLRTSAKFTESQKVEKKRFIDSVGELVAFCEKEGGAIPQYGDPDAYPEDVVDFTLNDLKSYTYNLVANELGLGAMIESYIKKLEDVDGSETDVFAALPTSDAEASEDFMNDLAAADWTEYLDSGIDEEIAGILEKVNA